MVKHGTFSEQFTIVESTGLSQNTGGTTVVFGIQLEHINPGREHYIELIFSYFRGFQTFSSVIIRLYIPEAAVLYFFDEKTQTKCNDTS